MKSFQKFHTFLQNKIPMICDSYLHTGQWPLTYARKIYLPNFRKQKRQFGRHTSPAYKLRETEDAYLLRTNFGRQGTYVSCGQTLFYILGDRGHTSPEYKLQGTHVSMSHADKFWAIEDANLSIISRGKY